MKLEILICTCNQRISQALEVLLPEQSNVRYLISHQVFEDVPIEIVDEANKIVASRTDVRLITNYSKGLSKNRNAALNSATGDIVLISDDDARYSPNGLEEFISVFEKSNSDVITFKIVTPNKEDYKRYSKTAFRHNKLTLMRVSSLEIGIRLNSLSDKTLRFAEQFGLGAKYPACEETIFLSDAIDAGLSVTFEPVSIVTHPKDSSGQGWLHDDSVKVRGALFRRVFGISGFPLLLIFTVKKYTEFRKQYSFFRFLWLAGGSFFRFSA